MPLASDGRQMFPVSQTNSYGRTMINKQMKTHDHLIMKAPALVNDKVAGIYMKQMDILHKAERFRPSYNIMKQRHDDDIVMANLIRDAQCTCDRDLDAHILRFRELRQKYPNHIPGWLERYEVGKTMEIHETVVKKAKKWIDDEPPRRALHYRQVLRQTQYTRGGFPRVNAPIPKKRRKKAKTKRRDLLPQRRTSLGFAEGSSMCDDEEDSPGKPDWALEEGDEPAYREEGAAGV